MNTSDNATPFYLRSAILVKRGWKDENRPHPKPKPSRDREGAVNQADSCNFTAYFLYGSLNTMTP